MKEFIEKLIGRLEEQAEQYRRRGFEHEQKGYSAMADKYYGKQCSYLHSIEIVNQLAEEYNNGWIPCSERLPEKDMWCLATFESGNVDKIQYLVTNNWGWNGMRGDNKVIAWMPLPAPYKE